MGNRQVRKIRKVMKAEARNQWVGYFAGVQFEPFRVRWSIAWGILFPKRILRKLGYKRGKKPN